MAEEVPHGRRVRRRRLRGVRGAPGVPGHPPRKAIRSTNLLERLFEENRRRTKVLPHAFGERPMLKLMFAAVIRASAKWRKLKVTNFEREQLRQLRAERDERFKRRHTPAVTPAPSPVSSKTGT